MIDLIFKLLNFGILVILVLYGYRRISPLLKKNLNAEKNTIDDLRHEHSMLKNNEQTILNELEAQEAVCSTLYDKVDTWKTAVKNQEGQRDADLERYAKDVENKRTAQSTIHSVKAVYQQVAPEVSALLETEARSYYSDEKKAHEAINRIIKNLKK